MNANANSQIKKERNFDLAGIPRDTTHKATPASNDIPDVISPPSKEEEEKKTFHSEAILCLNSLHC